MRDDFNDFQFTQEIRIEPTRIGTWRAWRMVSREWAKVPSAGMSALGTEPGFYPFVEAHGRTAPEALTALCTVLGECFVVADAWRHRPIEPGMRPDQITRTFEVTLEEAQVILATFVQPNGIDVDLTAKLDPEKLPSVRALVEFAREAEAQRRGKAP